MFHILSLGNIVVKNGLPRVWAVLTLCPWYYSSHAQYIKLDFPLFLGHSNDQCMLLSFLFSLSIYCSFNLIFMTLLHCLIKSWLQQHGPTLCCLITQQSLKYWNYKSCFILPFWFIICSVRESIIWLWRLHSIFTILTNEVIESFTLYMWYKT